MILKRRNLGRTVLAIYVILLGLNQLASLTFEGFHLVLGALGIAAGVLLLLGR